MTPLAQPEKMYFISDLDLQELEQAESLYRTIQIAKKCRQRPATPASAERVITRETLDVIVEYVRERVSSIYEDGDDFHSVDMEFFDNSCVDHIFKMLAQSRRRQEQP